MDIDGCCAPRFSAVKDAFAANFAAGEELGARFTLVEAGEVVVDLYGGYADRARTHLYDERTVTPIFSISKAIAALLLARLVDAGTLSYDQTVATIWPEFAQAGKERITVGQVLSHQAGLSGFSCSVGAAEWCDWDAICTRLAAMPPLWPPGTASGYHPLTFGYLAGEIFRRIDGRTMAAALREDIAMPFGLDLWLRRPADGEAALAELALADGLPRLADMSAAKLAAIRPFWHFAINGGFDMLMQSDNPGATGHATALALARLMGALADDGKLDGATILPPASIIAATRFRAQGEDLVLPAEMGWAAGFMRNPPNYYLGPGEAAFGHAGWGGSCAFADPERRLGGAYLMNKQGANLVGDERAGRAKRLFEAAYRSL